MNHKVYEALVDLQKSINRQSYIVSKLWAMSEHRCPLCNKPQFTAVDVDFTDIVGMCPSCDHILPDGWYDVRGEQ